MKGLLTVFLIVSVLFFSGCTGVEESDIDYELRGSEAMDDESADYQRTVDSEDEGGLVAGETDGCELLSGEMRDGCFFELATKKYKDSSFCSEISDFGIKSHCMALTTKDPAYCSGLQSDYGKYQCYMQMAEMLGDVSVCEPIENLDAPAWKQACESAAK